MVLLESLQYQTLLVKKTQQSLSVDMLVDIYSFTEELHGMSALGEWSVYSRVSQGHLPPCHGQ